MENMKLELELLEEVVAPGEGRDYFLGFLGGMALVGGTATIINIATSGALIAFT
ncbi:hypothetical protein HQN87_19700 [Paenibacillus tritici]|uniref:Uncharacterized protein n=1 Tax=Paenibacillus tritici TaxID=1873425 RepID=A0ABX2DVI8_9BACL|nr:hypothetical protein [Paenibacillus tritici]NQX47564.1 hypothetical protein [Paenibacillus tritici]